VRARRRWVGEGHLPLELGQRRQDSTALNAKLNKAPGVFDKATCSFSFTGSGSGSVSFFNGTGLYAGISGTARITLAFGGIGPRLASWACNQGHNARPLSQYGAIIGTGVVRS